MDQKKLLPESKEEREMKLKQIISSGAEHIQRLEAFIGNLNADLSFDSTQSTMILEAQEYIRLRKKEIYKETFDKPLKEISNEFYDFWQTISPLEPNRTDIQEWINESNWKLYKTDEHIAEVIEEMYYQMLDEEKTADDYEFQDRMCTEGKEKNHK